MKRILTPLLVGAGVGLLLSLQVKQTPSEARTHSIEVGSLERIAEQSYARMTIQAIVEVSRTNEVVGLPLGTSRLLYIAQGQVDAGFVLTGNKMAIAESGDTLIVSLPAPSITNTKIDVTKSKIYDHNRGFLGLGPDAPELQQQAQEEALKQITQVACKDGILNIAKGRAQQFLGEFVRSLGRDAEIKIPEGSCLQSTK